MKFEFKQKTVIFLSFFLFTSFIHHAFAFEKTWIEPGNKGLIWGDVQKDESGETISVNQNEAVDYCLSHLARLPTKEEYIKLAMYMGRGTAEGYKPQFLEGMEQKFWTATNWTKIGLPAYGVYFHGVFGDYDIASMTGKMSVRCVNDTY